MVIMHLYSTKTILIVLFSFLTFFSNAQSSTNKLDNEFTSQTVDYPYLKGLEYYKAKNYLLAAQYFRMATLLNGLDYDAYYLLSSVSKKYNYQEESCHYMRMSCNSGDSLRIRNFNQYCQNYTSNFSHEITKGTESIFNVDSFPTITNLRGNQISIVELFKTRIERYLYMLRDYYVPSLKKISQFDSYMFNIYIIVNEKGKVDDIFILDGKKICNYRSELVSLFNEELNSIPAKKGGINYPITYECFWYSSEFSIPQDINIKWYNYR